MTPRLAEPRSGLPRGVSGVLRHWVIRAGACGAGSCLRSGGFGIYRNVEQNFWVSISFMGFFYITYLLLRLMVLFSTFPLVAPAVFYGGPDGKAQPGVVWGRQVFMEVPSCIGSW